MNLRQHYTTFNAQERTELLVHMFQMIERRQRRRLLVRGRIIRDRRHRQRCHYINDRRQRRRYRWQQGLYWTLFISILGTVSAATFLLSLHLHPTHAARLIVVYMLASFAVMIYKPRRWRMAY